VRWALQLKETKLFDPPERDLATNADLIGQSYHSQDSVVQIVSLDPARPEKYVIVQDLATDKRWSAPAGLIRLALGNRNRRKKAA
jgi:hypothetical protein